jgi:hypothetical protein
MIKRKKSEVVIVLCKRLYALRAAYVPDTKHFDSGGGPDDESRGIDKCLITIIRTISSQTLYRAFDNLLVKVRELEKDLGGKI